MPKLGMEPIRKEALVKATIVEIGRVGSLDVTVGQIAKRAGMSPALAHHYFGSKEEMFLAAMRHILTLYGAEVRGALAAAEGPEGRIRAILVASFSPGNFRREAVSAWLNFWVLAQSVPQAKRLLAIYQRRLRSNLVAALRPLAGRRALEIAESLGAMIDGLYLREVLKSGPPDGAAAVAMALRHLEAELEQGGGE
ncbi:transcriptional regulator BetI [Tabrizicola sp. YIM 78059]|uniref:transcriptional regulator BetI n=1 Tax=Tabrizicola sp. YIM 78059 TaxID=2529861 RepID=UPI0010A9BB1D|nr:transcriptional regulator BetI [Tabrizicola sp. YIM 78059]